MRVDDLSNGFEGGGEVVSVVRYVVEGDRCGVVFLIVGDGMDFDRVDG